MMVRITAPKGQKIKHIPTNALHSEVICDEKKQYQYELADSSEAPIITPIPVDNSLSERVGDLEDAVVELAELISEVV